MAGKLSRHIIIFIGEQKTLIKSFIFKTEKVSIHLLFNVAYLRKNIATGNGAAMVGDGRLLCLATSKLSISISKG